MGLAQRKPVREVAFDVTLHPKQALAFETEATEVLYGGAAGGGKSHLMRIASIVWAVGIPGLQIYLFRRVRDDLIKNHMEGPKGYRSLLAEWCQEGICRIVDDEIRFRNGSKIYLCHCKDAKDVYKYQGAEIHVLLVDETTHFLEDMYRFLRNRVRMVGLTLPAWAVGRFPRVLCSANPGNVGHLWVKAAWIDDRVPLATERMPDAEGGMLRQYIPARVDDNPSLMVDDPGYLGRLSGLGSPALVKAMRDGDWDVVEGAFFSEWSRKRHVLQPFAIPAEWTKFVSGDWGSAKPFSFGWWAVVGDDFVVPGLDEGRVVLPRGALVRYREWYGCEKGKPNTGLKLTAEAVGKRLIEKTPEGEKVSYATLDPAMWSSDGGPSLAERLRSGMQQAKGQWPLRPADNKRVTQKGALGGWDTLRARLRGSGWTEDGPGPHWMPDIYCFETCTDSIRTIPVLQHDPDRPEDLDTDGEDHAGDDWRYAAMSRPYVAKPVEKPPQAPGVSYTAVQLPDGRIGMQSSKTIKEIVEERMRNRRRA